MQSQRKRSRSESPPNCQSVVAEAQKSFDGVTQFCQTSELSFGKFEK